MWKPITVTVRGAVRGEVSVGVEPKRGESGSGSLQPAPGDERDGAGDRGNAPIWTWKWTSFPSFMEVKWLVKIPDTPGSWDLTVRILPNKVSILPGRHRGLSENQGPAAAAHSGARERLALVLGRPTNPQRRKVFSW